LHGSLCHESVLDLKMPYSKPKLSRGHPILWLAAISALFHSSCTLKNPAPSVCVWTGFHIPATNRSEFFENLDRIGHALPLTEDGYMLTAAHVVADDLCGVPFEQNRPAVLLNSPQVAETEYWNIDKDGQASLKPSTTLGFRRLRIVKTYPDLDLAIVHVRGQWSHWFPYPQKPKLGDRIAGVRWEVSPTRPNALKVRRYSAQATNIRPHAQGWEIVANLGCTYGDSGSGVHTASHSVGVAIKGVQVGSNILNHITSIPEEEFNRVVHRDRLLLASKKAP
jgi:hypothetical protein